MLAVAAMPMAPKPIASMASSATGMAFVSAADDLGHAHHDGTAGDEPDVHGRQRGDPQRREQRADAGGRHEQAEPGGIHVEHLAGQRWDDDPEVQAHHRGHADHDHGQQHDLAGPDEAQSLRE